MACCRFRTAAGGCLEEFDGELRAGRACRSSGQGLALGVHGIGGSEFIEPALALLSCSRFDPLNIVRQDVLDESVHGRDDMADALADSVLELHGHDGLADIIAELGADFGRSGDRLHHFGVRDLQILEKTIGFSFRFREQIRIAFRAILDIARGFAKIASELFNRDTDDIAGLGRIGGQGTGLLGHDGKTEPLFAESCGLDLTIQCDEFCLVGNLLNGFQFAFDGSQTTFQTAKLAGDIL